MKTSAVLSIGHRKTTKKELLMRILLVTGTLGSGKTTLLLRLLAENHKLGLKKPLLIVNDVGRLNVDAERLRASGFDVTIQDMTSGCLDCVDREMFEKTIRAAVRTKTDLFIEPTGAANGDNLDEIFASVGIKPKVITLISGAHFERNRAYDPKSMESQIRHAHVIGITWSTAKSADSAHGSLLAYVGMHAPKAALYLVSHKSIPLAVLNFALENKNRNIEREKCGHECHEHTHQHEHHSHEHDHEHLKSFAHSITLRKETAEEDVAEVCNELEAKFGLVRAKGSFGSHRHGQAFDFVHGNLSFRKSAAVSYSANFISEKPVPQTALALLDSGVGLDAPISPKAVREAIRYSLANAWSPYMRNGDIREDNAFLYRALGLAFQKPWHGPKPNESVPRELRETVVKRYVSWYLAVAEALVQNDWKGNPKLPQWQRRVGVHLVLLALNFENIVGKKPLIEIARLKMARQAVKGLQALKPDQIKFNALDPIENPEQILRVAQCGMSREKLPKEPVLSAFRHCKNLSRKASWQDAWQKAIDCI